MKKYYLFFLIFLVLNLYVEANSQFYQDLRFERFSIEDGLSDNNVLNICQDQYGFIWMTTYAGINRYDGYQFTHFHKNVEIPDSVQLKGVYYLSVNNEGKIFFADQHYLFYYDDQLEKFSYLQDLGELKYKNNDIFSRGFIQDNNGDYWISTYGSGAYHIDHKTKKVTEYQHDPNDPHSLASDILSTIFEDSEGRIWFGSENGLELYIPEKDHFQHYQHDPDNPNSISSNKVISLYEDSYGFLWVGTWEGGLNCYDPKKNEFKRYLKNDSQPGSVSCNTVRTIFEDSRNNLWVGTQAGGLCLFQRESEEFYCYQYDYNNPYSINSNKVMSIYEDRNGILWIGTEYKGFAKLDWDKNQFKHYISNPYKKNSLTNSVVYSILIDEKKSNEIIWVGTNLGINIIDRTTGTIQYYRADPKKNNTINHDAVRAIYADHDGDIWVGTDGGLSQYQPQSNDFKQISFDGLTYQNVTTLNSIIADQFNHIWLGYYNNGLVVYNPDTKKHRHYSTKTAKKINGDIVTCLDSDLDHRIWIGFEYSGINCYDPQTDQFYKIEGQLSSKKIIDLFVDSKNILWVGTNGGLDQIDLNQIDQTDISQQLFDQLSVKNFTMSDGLCSDVIHSIIEDQNHNLWISTANGISCYNRDSAQFKSYSENDGLLTSLFVQSSSAMNQKGELFFGSVEGLTVFHPDSIKINLIPPKVFCTKFSLFNKPIAVNETVNDRVLLSQSMLYQKEIHLFYEENSFSIDFVGLHYHSPQSITYSYKMEGFDSDWITTQRRYAAYTNLSEGQYSFHLKATNADGIESREEVNIKFKIIPPFWKTIWFLISMIFIFIGSMIAFFSLRIKMIKDQKLALEQQVEQRTIELSEANDRLEELDHLKNDFIANVTHDFRSPLMIIINIADLAFKYGKELNDKIRRQFELIYNSGIKLGNTIDRLLDISKMDSSGVQLKVKKINIKSLLENLIDFYSSTISVTSSIEIKGVLPSHDIDDFYTDQDKLEEVLNNIVSNAIKFVSLDHGLIKIVLKDNDDSVSISVIDNGKGIPEKSLKSIFNRFEQADDGMESLYKGSGIGLAFAKQLVGFLHGKIHAFSEGSGKGAEFVIELPKGRDLFHHNDFVYEDIKDKQKEKGVFKRLLRMELEEKIMRNEISVIFSQLNEDCEFNYYKGKILVVDDSPNVREIVVEYLKNNGYQNFIVAADGVQGMQAAYDYQPDLIICDFNMPKLRGDELQEKLNKNPNFKHIPFIFLSAIADKDIILERKKEGAVAYLPKPVDENDLVLTVEVHLKKYMDYQSTFMLSTVDELTQLFNKRYMNERFEKRLSYREYKDFSVLFIDIDHFKSFNDNYGHQFGDEVLKTVGKLIKQSLREYDLAGRIGGEEFLVVLAQTSLSNAFKAAEKIKDSIEEFPFEYEDKELNITVSIGISSLKGHEEKICNDLKLEQLQPIFEVDDPKDTDWSQIKEIKQKIKEILIKYADEALYQAKTTKCNHCKFASVKAELFANQHCPKCKSEDLEWGRNKIVSY